MSSRMSDFVHLHVHSHYSLLSALPRMEELVGAAKESGQRAIALTDNGNLYGAIEFYKECKKQGMKPIIGVDLYVAPRTRHDKEHRIDNKTSRLILLAKHLAGYQNLVKLVSRAHLEGFYYTPRADRKLISEYRDGLIAILPSFAGEPSQHLKEGDRERSAESLAWYRETFGSDLYAEITHHPEIEGHEERMKKWGSFAKEHNVPLVAAHDVYYMKPGDVMARELVVKIKTGGHLDRDLGVGMEDFSFITSERANELFKDEEELLANSVTIADNCNLELALGKAILPDFPLPEGKTHDDLLRKLSEIGIAARGLTKTPELQKRIDYELGIIAKKGYAPYFLVVADLLTYARSQHIFTNTRGSAAGSLVSYLCGITTVDPIAFNMPFERFLNPDRPYAPDIDMDIADNRRDELIDYAREKYGADRVAQIGTFGTMMARAAVRDVSRALGHSYNVGDQIAKLIPFGKQGFAVTIDSALKEVADLRQVYENDPEAREVLDLAKKIEGNARHIGVHAAGVCIAPSPVVDFAPIQLDPKGGKIITQYDMYGIVDEYGGIGLIKFDFLGLKNLSILADAVFRVKNRLDREVSIDIIPRDDKKTFEMLSRGDTLGVFQLSGQGMTSYLKELEPSTVHDINAMVALYRPGPIAFIPDYISRKKNPNLVTYLDPRMEKTLKPTYGVLIYQDDVMTIAVELAGYSWVEADKFRKAMGKKIPEEMKAQKERFIGGCIKGGMKDASAKRLWEQIETFAAYGFNKCLAGDTLIRRKGIDGNAEDVPLLQLREGDRVASLDEMTGTLVWRAVEHITPMHARNIIHLETATGRRIRATHNHPFLVRDRGGRETEHPAVMSRTGWITLESLRKNEYIAAAKPRLGIFIDDANMFYGQRKNGWRIDYNKLVRLLRGAFDIRLTHYHMVVPKSSDSAHPASEKHRSVLQKLYGSLMTIKMKPLKYIWDAANQRHVKKGDVDGELIIDALTHGDDLDAVMIMSGDSDYRILAETLRAKGKKVFFAGFENTMAWELRQMHHLYLNQFREHLDSGKKEAPAEAGVPLLISRLYADASIESSGAVEKDFIWTRIATIKKGDPEQTYDIGVADTHSFIGNGLIVHNSHAVSYGNLAYQTAYMKANYSVDYMAALLTADAGDVEEIGGIVAECKRMGIAVLAPDVNESMRDFTVVGDMAIRFGLSSIKNFGEGVAQSIIDARTESGQFTSLSDFLARVTDKNLNKKSLEALIQSGALDNFGERGAMFGNIEALLAHHKEHASGSADQDSLFGGSSKTNDIRLASVPKASFLQKLAWEKELLGLYISGHPLDAHRVKLEKQKFDIAKTKEKLLPDTQTTISGIIEHRHEVLTKNGEKMAFITIADYGSTIETVAFPRVLKEYGNILAVGNCVIIKGRVSQRNGEKSFVAEAVKPL